MQPHPGVHTRSLRQLNQTSSIMTTAPRVASTPNPAFQPPIPTKAARSPGQIGTVFFWKTRNTWAYEYKTPEGKLRRTSHGTAEAAQTYCKQIQVEWLAANEQALDETRTRRYLGGPEGVTLAQMLGEYAVQITCQKLGAQQELSTINRFLRAAALPELRLVKGDKGAVTIEKRQTLIVLPQAFVDRLQAIRERQPLTSAEFNILANLPIRGIGTHHIKSLMKGMRDDGLTDSTRQKLYALIRHAFATAMGSWDWPGLINPCKDEKFSNMGYKHVVVTDAQIVMLRNALAERAQPAYAVMFELALATALRPGSLLSLEWQHVDLQHGIVEVKGKGRWLSIPLSPIGVDVLRSVYRPGATRVFEVTGEGLRQSWRDARIKAGLPHLQFQDLRHVAATRLAKNMDAFSLQKVLGHKTLAMALHYVNLTSGDVKASLANAEAQRTDLVVVRSEADNTDENLTDSETGQAAPDFNALK